MQTIYIIPNFLILYLVYETLQKLFFYCVIKLCIDKEKKNFKL